MRASNADAKRAIKAFVKRAEQNADQVLREVALTILTAIVRRSPVDTGHFRGNWAVQVSEAPQTTAEMDKAGSGVIAKAQTELARFRVGTRIYMLNHLPYSIELENGSSTQAPRGMVKITVTEFTNYVNRAVEGLAVR